MLWNRLFLPVSLIGALSATAALAQTTPVIGFLNSASVSGYAPMAAAFREGLKQTGFVPGENVQIEYRWANDSYDKLPQLAKELVVNARMLPSLVVPTREVEEFRPQKSGLNGVQAAIVAFDIVEILPRLAMVAQHPTSRRDSLVVRCDSARLAARS